MGILLFFAFLSGLVTIFAPCIWPILPIILSASSTGGHRKPLGLTLGIIVSFGVLTLSISYLIRIIPFDPNSLRLLSVLVIAILGLTLLIPKLSKSLEGLASRLVGKFGGFGGPAGNGFWSGVLTGTALGVVWTPCTGPILATIATLAATQAVNSAVVLVTVSYVLGVGIPLFLFATIGRTILTKSRVLSPFTGKIQQAFGVVMLLMALAIWTGYDKVLEARLLNMFPSFQSGLVKLETNPEVTKQLDLLRGGKTTLFPETLGLFNSNAPAPDFVGITKWLNTEKPLSIKELKGKVVLVDFWTYTCINCIRTLPFVTRWYDKYKDQGFVVVGVHTPEFLFEQDTKNVENAIAMFHINYPVGQDNDYRTWNNFNNQYWPAEYLVDANGKVRRVHFGEGEYDKTEEAIQTLLKEAGKSVSMPIETLPDQTPKTRLSPETYLGSKRMEFYDPLGHLDIGKQNFSLSESPSPDSFSFGGEWTITDETAIAGNQATLTYNFYANNVYLILRPVNVNGSTQGTVKVFLDGQVVGPAIAGSNVQDGMVSVEVDQLYHLINLHGNAGQHILKLEFQTPGIQAYTFTFG